LDIWDKTVEALRGSVKPYDFANWIRPIQCDRVDQASHQIVLRVPDDSHGQWLEEHFSDRISDAIATLTDTPYSLRFLTNERPTVEAVAPPHIPKVNSPAVAPPELVSRYRFETFVAGPNSRFALTAAQSAAEQPGDRYNPLFIYGGVGLGKTHLLHAVGHQALAQNPSARVLYVSSETYVNDLIAAIRSGQMDRFRIRYRDECDVLLIDDIQFIAGKDRTQEEFFHMFNTLHSSHKQIVMTCDQMPSTIPDLEERLCSRLQWGLIADIKPPSFETRVAIIERKAVEDGITLPKDVAMLLARHISRNVRELEGALMRLDAQARIFGQPIDLETTRTFLGDIVDSDLRRVSPQLIIKAVCETFDITESALKGPRRHRHVTQPRQVAMYLIRELTDESLPRIGSLFGGRDHTTVLNALKRIKQLKSANPILRDRIVRLSNELSR
jgi:chromosomal replication initiator protein